MNERRHPVGRWVLRISRACAFLSGIALLLMMIAGASDVIGTNLDIIGLQSQPVPAAFEFMATMMVVTVFLGTALAQARRNHIRVEVIVDRLPPGGRKFMELVQHLLSALMWGLIAWYGWKSGIHSVSVGEYATGLINFPTWPARLILAVGATLMTVQCLFDVLGV
ncbi:MAG: TRAP transporter small permease [Magnetovibrio sp.]|nr:TRAP transporter small permease [Magnetovibrio sp.]